MIMDATRAALDGISRQFDFGKEDCSIEINRLMNMIEAYAVDGDGADPGKYCQERKEDYSLNDETIGRIAIIASFVRLNETKIENWEDMQTIVQKITDSLNYL